MIETLIVLTATSLMVFLHDRRVKSLQQHLKVHKDLLREVLIVLPEDGGKRILEKLDRAYNA